jgi:REP element-mobilizing transposase RayT
MAEPAMDARRHHRHSLRLPGYDYAQPGAYFVTLCAWQRACVFGDIADGQMQLNDWGRVAVECWTSIPAHFERATVDEWVIMPNHLHGILVITEGTSPAAVGAPPIGVGATQIVGATHWVAPTPRPGPRPGSIGAIMAQYKSVVTKRINVLRATSIPPVWQRNYYEHVVRNDREMHVIRQYIHNNPAKWALDRDNAAYGRPEAATADDYVREVEG